MEQTTFQQRIEERAKQRLYKDLHDFTQKLKEVDYLTELKTTDQLYVIRHNDYGGGNSYTIKNGQEIFDKLLPKYIQDVTDEILKKVDEIDWLLSEKNQEQDY